MSELAARIETILADDSLDADDLEDSKCERIREIANFDWDTVLQHVLLVLRDDSRRKQDWETVAEVLWDAACDSRPIPVAKTVAHLCRRWPVGASQENNLAWSIVCKLKRLDYLSNYDPNSDTEVLAELRALD